MKKNICLLAAVLFTLTVHAEYKFGTIEQLPETQNKGFYFPVFSPKGDFLLLSTENYAGLMRYDLASGEQTVLTKAPRAGYLPQISEGGSVVVYREAEIGSDGLRRTAIKARDMQSGSVTEIDAATRQNHAFAMVGGEVRVAKGQQMVRRTLVKNAKQQDLMVSNEELNLVLYRGNQRTVLNPQGDGNYIWASLSPDKKHIVYACTPQSSTICQTYVCDLNGKQVVCLGYVGAPQWLGNSHIVGHYDVYGDGYTDVKSQLVFVAANGSDRRIYDVPGHPVVLYPAANAQGNKIAFAADNAVYTMSVSIK